MSEGGKAPKGAKVSHPFEEPKPKERVVNKIGAFAGVSGRTVEKIAQVVEAADKEPGPRLWLPTPAKPTTTSSKRWRSASAPAPCAAAANC